MLYKTYYFSSFDTDLSYKSYDRGPSYTGGGGRLMAEQK